MTNTELESDVSDLVASLMIQYGPDGHCDGHEIIAKEVIKFIKSKLEQDLEKAEKYDRQQLSEKDRYKIFHEYFEELHSQGITTDLGDVIRKSKELNLPQCASTINEINVENLKFYKYQYESSQQQNKKLTDEIKQLQKESYSRLLRLNERNQEIQNLKEKIQELIRQLTVRIDILSANYKTCDSDESLKLIDIRNDLKEILGVKI